jgi:hypothetical protein
MQTGYPGEAEPARDLFGAEASPGNLVVLDGR